MESTTPIENVPLFFIIGRPRSGTTLLRFYFDAHPNVQIPVECNFIFQLHSRYGKTTDWSPQRISSFVRDLRRTRFFGITGFDLQRIEKALLENRVGLTYQTACKIVISTFNSFYPKRELLLVGDKNPLYAFIFDMIFPVFPDARFIHLIRDPRDVYLSSVNAGFGYPLISWSAYLWKHSFQLLEIFKKAESSRFYTVRYEDFLTDPEKYLKEMCIFLTIPFDPAMMDYLKFKEDFSVSLPHISASPKHSSVNQQLDPTKIYGWKKKMSLRKQKLAEWYAGEALTMAGYEKQYFKKTIHFYLHLIPVFLLGVMQKLFFFLYLLLPFRSKSRLFKVNYIFKEIVKRIFFRRSRKK